MIRGKDYSRQTTQQQQQQLRPKTVDILYGAQGSHPGFLAELEASVKSVLLNAPLDVPLRIHFLVDQEAQNAISTQIFRHFTGNDDGNGRWKTRQPFTVTTYNVESLVPRWMGVVNNTYRHFPQDMDWYRHTPGAYFRLFADEVLPDDVENFLYMDSDVVVMANLGELWKQVGDRTSYFQWGQELCSGFLVINKTKLKDFWRRIQDYDILRLKGYTVRKAQKKVRQRGLGDQFLLRAMNATEPFLIEPLPVEWDVSANDGPWWARENRGEGLENDRGSGVGMMHFNGGRGSKLSAFDSHMFLADEKDFPNTWGLAHYYNRLPWQWARYMAKSQLGPDGGHLIVTKHFNGLKAIQEARSEI